MKDESISHKRIERFCREALLKVGVRSDIAVNVASGLTLTSLRGVDSHGIRLLPHYVRAVRVKRINPNPKYKFFSKRSATCVMDADDGFGIDAGILAMTSALELAKKCGVGAVSVHKSTHFSSAAIYGLLAAKKGAIGLCFTSTDSLVIPFGGKRPFLGTNPICFCAPMANEEPFCLDMATSVVPLNKIMNYRSTGKKLEEGWAMDKLGRPTRNPKKAIWLMPFGGYKGFGLEIMVEILSSLLAGMDFGKHITKMYPLTSGKRRLGHFFIAVDIASFIKLESFKKNLQSLCDEIRSQPRLRKDQAILVPGDPEKVNLKIRYAEGIPVDKSLLYEFNQLAKEIKLGVDFL